MGNPESKPDTLESKLSNYQLLNTEVDDRLGEVSIYKSKQSGEFVWVKDILLEEEKALTYYSDYINSKDYLTEDFITKEAAFIGNDSGYCGSCGSAQRLLVFMDYFDRDLEGEFLRREEEKDHFPEAEIWYILESILIMEEEYMARGTLHGDIRASNIFITEEGILGNNN